MFCWLFNLLIYIYYYCRSFGHWHPGAIFFIKYRIAAGFANQVHSWEKPLGDRLRICDDDEHANDSFWKCCFAEACNWANCLFSDGRLLRISEFCEIRNIAPSHEGLWLFFPGMCSPERLLG